jgi:hypothetical protein
MSGSPSWDYQQPPAPDPAQRAPQLPTEPSGYNLGDVSYKQPPVPLLQHWAEPAALPTGQATAGFILSLSGLVSISFLPVIMLPALIVGLVLSAISLSRCRRGLAGGRGFAIAGLVIGILGIVLTGVAILLLLLAFRGTGG